MYENAVAIKEKIENFNIMFFGKNMAQNLELNPEDPDPKGTVYRLDNKPISTQRFYQRWLAKRIYKTEIKFWPLGCFGQSGLKRKKTPPNCHKYASFWGGFFNFFLDKKKSNSF